MIFDWHKGTGSWGEPEWQWCTGLLCARAHERSDGWHGVVEKMTLNVHHSGFSSGTTLKEIVTGSLATALAELERLLVEEFDVEGRIQRADARGRREERRLAEVEAALADPEIQAALRAMPHWHEWRAAQGDTMLDWAVWKFGGGRLASGVKAVEKMLKDTGLVER